MESVHCWLIEGHVGDLVLYFTNSDNFTSDRTKARRFGSQEEAQALLGGNNHFGKTPESLKGIEGKSWLRLRYPRHDFYVSEHNFLEEENDLRILHHTRNTHVARSGSSGTFPLLARLATRIVSPFRRKESGDSKSSTETNAEDRWWDIGVPPVVQDRRD